MIAKKSTTKKSFFEPVNTKIDFPKMERELMDYWEKKGVVSKYLEKNKTSKKYFSFLDGPITANNPMGIHHGWGRTYKDLWQRYKNMQGYKQRFQNGFDAQGLWVEVEVEKEHDFRSKKDIEKYGVAKFVQECKDRVMKFSEIQTQQSKRLGYFMDWDNSYYTMTDTNNYMIWHFIKKCHEHGWLYKGKGSVPWCPRCETAISQHEMLTEDYKEVVHKAIYFILPLEGRKKEFLLVWTTTPWTLPANIAVAVDSKMTYSLVEGSTGDKYWVAKSAAGRIFGKGAKTVKVVKGSELLGLKYKWAFDHLPAAEKASEESDLFHTVVATDDRIMPISADEGTGMVHTAVSAGSEDFKLGKKLGLPMIPVIADNADYLEGLGEFTGKNAKKHPEVILDYLVKEDKKGGNNWVFDIANYKHRYPGCWRCKTELVWKVTNEWYIAMDKKSVKDKGVNLTLRNRMRSVAKKINWIPEFGLKRELDWLKNMHDWLISKKNRYWGLALPIWECGDCDWFEVVGSKEELKKLAVKGWSQFSGKSPHKPQIDAIKLKCPKCEGLAKRVAPVGNPWLDAGITPFSTISDNNKEPLYNKDRSKWKKWFPADFITESFPGQFKNWFYSLIAMSTVLEKEIPSKTILGFGTLLGEDGRAMHKSWGNAVEFGEGADKIGVDVMRWMYTRQDPKSNLLFGYQGASEVRRSFHLKLWNVYNFFVTYANLDGWSPGKSTAKPKPTALLDKWILTRFDQALNEVEMGLESFNAQQSSFVIEKFVDDLSNWYIRRSRGRVGLAVSAGSDKSSFYQTTYYVLINLCKILAPFTPFMADNIYQNLTKELSVHLTDWPAEHPKTNTQDLKLLTKMDHLREIVEKVHSERKTNNFPVRQPLASVEVTSPEVKPNAKLATLLLDEVNVKKLVWKKGATLKIKLDKKITPALEQEAKTRMLIRDIQKQRRSMGVDLKQKVTVTTPWLPSDKDLLDLIKTKTLAHKLSKGKFSVVLKNK